MTDWALIVTRKIIGVAIQCAEVSAKARGYDEAYMASESPRSEK